MPFWIGFCDILYRLSSCSIRSQNTYSDILNVCQRCARMISEQQGETTRRCVSPALRTHQPPVQPERHPRMTLLHLAAMPSAPLEWPVTPMPRPSGRKIHHSIPYSASQLMDKNVCMCKRIFSPHCPQVT